jgi:hypothetical protein
MVQVLILALLFQGPKNLQVDQDAKLKPPLTVPAGTAIPVKLLNRLSTKDAKDGDSIYAQTTFPITENNEIVIPVGSYVRGKVLDVARPGRVKGKGEMTISFQSLTLPTGATVALYGTLGSVGGIATRKGETGVQGDGSKGQDAGTVLTTTGEGAALGGLAGRSAKGVGIGAAAGAAAGVAGVLLSRGKDLVLEPGTTLEVVLDRPLEP